ncbi:MAG: formylglycine-generating enzyme family protein, partial [Polyangiaceae bacterium]
MTTMFFNPSYEIAQLQPTVSSFALDKYEVTVGRFRAFVNALGTWTPTAGVGGNPRVPGSGWQAGWPLAGDGATLSAALSACPGTWTAAPGPNENKPITCVRWYELFAFCAWDGGRLPTMTERVYASLGGADERGFPWSIPPDSGIVSAAYAVYSADGGNPPTGPDAVGSKPLGAGKWGQLDLGGNAGEWSLDAFPPESYPSPPRACVDCAVLGRDGGARVYQGGSYSSTEDDLRGVSIEGADPLLRSPMLGGRCAHSITGAELGGGAVGPPDCTPAAPEGGDTCSGCFAGGLSGAFTCQVRMDENVPVLSETLQIGPLSGSQDLTGSGFSLVPGGQGDFAAQTYGAQDLD